MDEKEGRFEVRLDDEKRPVFGKLAEEESFRAAFSFAGDLYHPNEITADSFARFVIEELFAVPAGERASGERAEALAGWFKENLAESDP